MALKDLYDELSYIGNRRLIDSIITCYFIQYMYVYKWHPFKLYLLPEIADQIKPKEGDDENDSSV